MKFLINKLMFKDESPIIPAGLDIEVYEGNVPMHGISCFLFGSMSDVVGIRRSNISRDINTLFDPFDVSSYLEMLGRCGLNYCDSYFKLSCQLSTADLGKFIRSDSGWKVLTGQILDHALLSQINQRTHPYVAPDDLLFLAPDQNIDREFRLWVMNDEIVAHSEYSWDKDKEIKSSIPCEVLTFALKVITRFSPGVAYVMDIATLGALGHGGCRVIEYNGFSTSGFYDVDLERLLKAVEAYYGRE